jgi:hypothetical protein
MAGWILFIAVQAILEFIFPANLAFASRIQWR